MGVQTRSQYYVSGILRDAWTRVMFARDAGKDEKADFLDAT